MSLERKIIGGLLLALVVLVVLHYSKYQENSRIIKLADSLSVSESLQKKRAEMHLQEANKWRDIALNWRKRYDERGDSVGLLIKNSINLSAKYEELSKKPFRLHSDKQRDSVRAILFPTH